MRTQRLFILAVSFLLGLTSTLCAEEPARQPQRKRRILCNYDGWGVLLDRKGSKKHVAITVDDLKEAVREVTEEGSQVDTVLICVNARVMYYPTKVGTVLGELATAEQRAKWSPVDKLWLDNLQKFFADGNDPWAIMLAEARERGVEGLLSFRMNDMHQGEILDTKFWRDHWEFRRGRGLDFGRQEVRDHTFQLIQEAVQRYDCDGIELDFNRFPKYFKEGTTAGRTAKMNELVKRIREMLDREGKKRNRRLVLGVRAPSRYPGYSGPPTYQDSLRHGCDPAIWSKNGWIDFLIISRFSRVSYDLPMASWKKRVPEVPIYGSIAGADAKTRQPLTPKDYRRAARKIWDDQGDGIYLFNFLLTRPRNEPLFEVLEQLGDPHVAE